MTSTKLRLRRNRTKKMRKRKRSRKSRRRKRRRGTSQPRISTPTTSMRFGCRGSFKASWTTMRSKLKKWQPRSLTFFGATLQISSWKIVWLVWLDSIRKRFISFSFSFSFLFLFLFLFFFLFLFLIFFLFFSLFSFLNFLSFFLFFFLFFKRWPWLKSCFKIERRWSFAHCFAKHSRAQRDKLWKPPWMPTRSFEAFSWSSALRTRRASRAQDLPHRNRFFAFSFLTFSHILFFSFLF